jgi:cysteine desulfurase/selenocysteine lyase
LKTGVAYLDTGATSQTPEPVIAAVDDYYRHHRASVHRGVYALAIEATGLFEGARTSIATRMGVAAENTVFARNATELFNLVSRGWGETHVQAGDRILVSRMEHHSNFVPWWRLAKQTGAELVEVPIDNHGRLDREALTALLPGARLLALTHVSNVLGTINPVAEIVAQAREQGVVTVIDGAQAVPQIPVDVGAIDADFYVWTGHKAYGPTGIGVLHGRRERLLETEPLLGGGHMIAKVSYEEVRFAAPPERFEAGTSAIAEAVGLGTAIEWLDAPDGAGGIDAVRAHGKDVTGYALQRLAADVPGITLFGPGAEAPDDGCPDDKAAVVSFALDGVHPHDVAEILARHGVCVRAGHHCAQPLMDRLGVSATTRASFAVHTTCEEIDQLVDGLLDVRRIFGD